MLAAAKNLLTRLAGTRPRARSAAADETGALYQQPLEPVTRPLTGTAVGFGHEPRRIVAVLRVDGRWEVVPTTDMAAVAKHLRTKQRPDGTLWYAPAAAENLLQCARRYGDWGLLWFEYELDVDMAQADDGGRAPHAYLSCPGGKTAMECGDSRSGRPQVAFFPAAPCPPHCGRLVRVWAAPIGPYMAWCEDQLSLHSPFFGLARLPTPAEMVEMGPALAAHRATATPAAGESGGSSDGSAAAGGQEQELVVVLTPCGVCPSTVSMPCCYYWAVRLWLAAALRCLFKQGRRCLHTWPTS